MQSTINMLYSAVKNKKKKERFETILEPLQAILQIGYLSFTPIGTKLTIHNNILQIQHPNYSQPVIRWYNNDTQEDLFYLFNIFYRFKKFYFFLNDGLANKNEKANSNNKKLYALLIELAKNGIANLIRTYSQTEKIHILHTLQMYKNILEGGNESSVSGNITKRIDNFEIDNLIISPASNVSRNLGAAASAASAAAASTPPQSSASFLKKDNKKKQHQQQLLREDDDDGDESNIPGTSGISEDVRMKELSSVIHKNDNSQDVRNIDDIFIRITDIYTQEMYNIMYNTLILIKNNEQMYNSYMDGLNKMLEPTNNRIKKWIDENIVF
jgi:hypothetical protein